jgi:phage FluMu gp28-like protein
VSELELKPDICFPYQCRWLWDNSKVKVAVKSRRIGLTWAEALDAVLIASQIKREGGTDYLYISTREDLAKEFIDTCSDWARAVHGYRQDDWKPEDDMWVSEDDAIKAYSISFIGGCKIYALSSNPSNMRGMQGVVCIDEAAHQQNLPALMKAAMALLMWGGKLRIISTHNGEAHPFNSIVKAIKQGKSNFVLHEYPIDLALSEGLYKRICEVGGELWSQDKEDQWLKDLVADYGEHAAEELYCQPSSGSGQFFNRHVVESAATIAGGVLRFSCSQNFIDKQRGEQLGIVNDWLNDTVAPYIDKFIITNYKTYAGLDFGRSHDLTVLSILIEDIDKVRSVPLIVELRNTPFHCQAQITRFILGKFKRLKKAAFDATGNGSFLAEEMALDFGTHRINQVKLTAEYYLSHFPRYKAALGLKTLTLPNDEDIIDDHLTVQLIQGVPKVPTNMEFTGADMMPRHGDAAISLMLAYSVVPTDTSRKKPNIWARTESYYRFT